MKLLYQIFIFSLIFLSPITMADNFNIAQNIDKNNNNPFEKEITQNVPPFFLEYERTNNKDIIIIHIQEGFYLYKDKIYSDTLNIDYELIPYVTINDPLYGEVDVIKNTFFIEIKSEQEHLITIQGCDPQNNICFPPEYYQISHEFNMFTIEKIDSISKKEDFNLIQYIQDSNQYIQILIFLIIGIITSFTPCVLHMIPILSLCIIDRAKNIKPYQIAISYVLGSSFLYGLLGIVMNLGLLGFQSYIQKSWVIILTSIIIALFGFIMLDKINIYKIKTIGKINNSLNNKLQKLEFNRKNSFIIGFLSALILSPCVSAPMGAILIYTSTQTDILESFLYLFIFGIGLGLILILSSQGLSKIKAQHFTFTKYLLGGLLILTSIYILSRIINIDFIIYILYIFTTIYILELFLKSKNIQFNLYLPLLIFTLGTYYFVEKPISEKDTHDYFISNLNEVNNINRENFVIKVYADWCVYCRDMEDNLFPYIEDDTYKIYTLDITQLSESEREIMLNYNAISAPALIIFKDGEYSETHNGNITLDDYKNLLFN